MEHGGRGGGLLTLEVGWGVPLGFVKLLGLLLDCTVLPTIFFTTH